MRWEERCGSGASGQVIDLINTEKNSCFQNLYLLMNFPIEKPNVENETASPRELMERAISATIMEVMQLRRTLWLVLKQSGPMTLDESQCHPLWRMKASRTDDNKVQLEAVQLPEPTDEQLKKLDDILNGTRMELQAAMDQTELKDHPPQYIEMRLRDRVRLAETGYWMAAALYKIADSEPTGHN